MVPTDEKRERLKDNPRNRYGAILRERSLKNIKLTRRFSFTGGVDSYQDEWMEEWRAQVTDQTTTIKNQVLVSLQEQERKDMKTVIAERRNDIINTWKKSARRRSEHASLEKLDDRRIQNISWRMWFKDHMKRNADIEPVDILEVVTGYLPDFPSKLFSPQDLYQSDYVGIEDLPIRSPTSAVQKRLFLETFDDYPGVEAA